MLLRGHRRRRCKRGRCARSAAAMRQSRNQIVPKIVRCRCAVVGRSRQTRNEGFVSVAEVTQAGEGTYRASIVQFTGKFALRCTSEIEGLRQLVANAGLEFGSPSRGKVQSTGMIIIALVLLHRPTLLVSTFAWRGCQWVCIP